MPSGAPTPPIAWCQSDGPNRRRSRVPSAPRRDRGRERGADSHPPVHGLCGAGRTPGAPRSLRRRIATDRRRALRVFSLPTNRARRAHRAAHAGRLDPARTERHRGVRRPRGSAGVRGRGHSDGDRARARGRDLVPDVAARARGLHVGRGGPDRPLPAADGPWRKRTERRRCSVGLVGGVPPRGVEAVQHRLRCRGRTRDSRGETSAPSDPGSATGDGWRPLHLAVDGVRWGHPR